MGMYDDDESIEPDLFEMIEYLDYSVRNCMWNDVGGGDVLFSFLKILHPFQGFKRTLIKYNGA